MELAQDRGHTATVLRGLSNLSAVQGSLDPRAAYDTAREVVTLARRLGQGGASWTPLGNAAANGFLIGDWDWAIRELSAAIEEETEEFNRNYHRWNLAPIRAARGEDVGGELDDLVGWAEGMEETFARGAIHGLKGDVAFGSGRFAEATDEMLKWAVVAGQDASNASGAAAMAGIAALAEHDRPSAQSALTILESLKLHGRLPDADRILLRAGIGGLEGRVEEARQGFQRAQAGYRDLGVVWRVALAGLVMVSVLGPGDPVARAAGEESSAVFARLGARPMHERLEALMAAREATRPPEEVPDKARAETLAEAG